MDPLQQARELRDFGRFGDALNCLESALSDCSDKTGAQVLRAELLERVGQRQEAQSLAKKLLSSKSLGWSDKSVCDFVLARIAIDRQEFDAAVAHLNKSIDCAQRAADTDKVCA